MQYIVKLIAYLDISYIKQSFLSCELLITFDIVSNINNSKPILHA